MIPPHVIAMFNEVGVKPLDVTKEMFIGEWADILRLRYIVGRDKIDIAVEESFDRWANSLDFWCRVPRNEGHLKFILEAAKSAIKDEDCYSPGFAMELEIVVRGGIGKVLISK